MTDAELAGHLDVVEQCRDYLNHVTMDHGDPSGKLQDFANSLRAVLDHVERQRACQHCKTTDPDLTHDWTCSTCVRQLRASRDTLALIITQAPMLHMDADKDRELRRQAHEFTKILTNIAKPEPL